MRNLICSLIALCFLLGSLPGIVYSQAPAPESELVWEYMTPFKNSRDIDTVSLHILKKISETKNKSVYAGMTITRPVGKIDYERKIQDSSAVGIGPMYLFRTEKHYSGKLSAAFDISGGFILYNNPFPASGRYYNFMWRAGPKFIYKFNKNSAINLGFAFMHVSNGFSTHNPGYDARGFSFGYMTNF